MLTKEKVFAFRRKEISRLRLLYVAEVTRNQAALIVVEIFWPNNSWMCAEKFVLSKLSQNYYVRH